MASSVISWRWKWFRCVSLLLGCNQRVVLFSLPFWLDFRSVLGLVCFSVSRVLGSLCGIGFFYPSWRWKLFRCTWVSLCGVIWWCYLLSSFLAGPLALCWIWYASWFLGCLGLFAALASLVIVGGGSGLGEPCSSRLQPAGALFSLPFWPDLLFVLDLVCFSGSRLFLWLFDLPCGSCL